MELKEHSYKIKGMNMDLSNSIFSPEFSWKNKNIRLSVRGSNDTLLVSNERGNKVLSVNEYFRDPSGITFNYTPELTSYVEARSEAVYTYSPSLSQYLSIRGAVEYSYFPTISNYLSQLIQPTYSYVPVLSNYLNEKINQ